MTQEVFEKLYWLLTTGEFTVVAESLGVLSEAVKVTKVTMVELYAAVDWVVEQAKNPDVKRVRNLIMEGKKPTETQRKLKSSGIMRLLSHWDRFHVMKGVHSVSLEIRLS